jgi:transposase InsO family protein
MTWKETCTVSERRLFVEAWLSQDFEVAALCERFGIARKTGHKWINRFKEEGMSGLENRSRARHEQAHRTPAAIRQRILALKYQYPEWGPVTIQSALYRAEPERHWPAVSTIGALLAAHGLVKPKQPRQKTPPHSQPLAHATEPNAVWSADFKGQFRLGDGQWCYPLTMTDNHSRVLLACKGLSGPQISPSIAVYKQVFREYGLPAVIRTDNGWPFSMNALGGLSPLAIWLLRLGVYPERIAPGCPQENGRHERMHRTLKAATANPPKGNLAAQQRAFNRFMTEFNEERPHQGLERGQCPIDVHRPSPRCYPETLPQLEYPAGFAVRKVKCGGYIKLSGEPIYTTRQLTGEYVGLEPLDHGRWQLYFGALKLGVVDERIGRVIRPS